MADSARPPLVRSRVLECYKPGSGRPLDRSQVRYLMVHHTSLSKYGDDNPHPIPDALIDAPALCGRFSNPALGTGGRPPYHGLTLLDGRNEQCLPLSIRGAHAIGCNGASVAWAVVGETAPANSVQLEALADVCAVLLPWLGLGALSIVGHTDLPGTSRDPAKKCPRPTIDVPQLRLLVADRLPSGWQAASSQEAEDRVVGAGLVV